LIKHDQCQINNFKKNFSYRTSENEKINKFIQEMQLKISEYNNVMVEWIPYNKFDDIKEIGKGDSATVYLAIWTDGPLQYDFNYKKLKRKSNEKVALKYFPMKKECPEIVTENVRVYLEMSGKCLSFDPKNDQIFRPNFF